jgi:hypothetical protein
MMTGRIALIFSAFYPADNQAHCWRGRPNPYFITEIALRGRGQQRSMPATHTHTVAATARNEISFPSRSRIILISLLSPTSGATAHRSDPTVRAHPVARRASVTPAHASPTS